MAWSSDKQACQGGPSASPSSCVNVPDVMSAKFVDEPHLACTSVAVVDECEAPEQRGFGLLLHPHVGAVLAVTTVTNFGGARLRRPRCCSP